MIEKSRLRLSAGLIALTLTLGACGGPDQGASAPASSAAQPSGSAAPSTTAAPSPSPSSTAAASSSAASSAPASSSAAEGSSADGSSAAASSSDAPAPSAAAAEGTAPVAGRPAPVTVDAAKPPAAQDLGGSTAGVAPKDTPVSVSTPRPQIPTQKVAPEDVRPPAAAPAPGSASSSAAKPGASSSSSATTATPSASAPSSSAAVPAPAGPVPHAGANCAVVRCVALTFDDGPSRHTGRLLNILSAERVPATFYVVGSSVALNPELVGRMAAEGHQVGSHSYTHPNLTTLSAAQVTEEMSRTAAAIRAAGATPSTVRAPYGALNETVLGVLGQLPRSGSVTWSVDTRDWEHKDPAQTLANVKAQTRPGAIILLHDLHSTTVDAVPSVIAWLKAQGYTLVTVDEITGGVASGRTVGSGMHP